MAHTPPMIDGLPAAYVERLQKQFPNDWESIVELSEQRVPVLRVNTMKASEEEVLDELAQQEMLPEPVPEIPGSFIMKRGTRKQLTDTESYEEGKFYIQSLASQLIVRVLDPQPGETVMDLCAAPGSKTTQIAAMMNAEGELLANDNSRPRMFRLLSNLKQQGFGKFVEVKNYAGQNYPKFYPEHFDRILVDAPCSSESRFQRRYPKSIKFWSRHKVKACAKLQRRLLSAAIQCLKPGGHIVYSTCTFAPEENELVLSKTMKKHPEIQLLPIETSYERLPILKEWNGESIHEEVQKALRLKPTAICEGFFMAKIQKTA